MGNRRRRHNMLNFELTKKPSLDCVISPFTGCEVPLRTEAGTVWEYDSGDGRDGKDGSLFSAFGHVDTLASMSWKTLVDENYAVAGYTQTNSTSGNPRGWDAIITE